MNQLLKIGVALLCVNVNAFAPNPMGVRKSQTTFSATLEGRVIEGEMKPTNNFILVKVADAIEETAGGIILAGKVSRYYLLFLLYYVIYETLSENT